MSDSPMVAYIYIYIDIYIYICPSVVMLSTYAIGCPC